MKQTKDVLILGAGASKPFGFPVGQELKTEAFDGLAPGNSEVLRVVNQAGEKLGYTPVQVNAFRKDLEGATREFSIDTFIESCRGRPEQKAYTLIAKAVTAVLIMKHEAESKIENGDWYSKLFDLMYDGNNNFETFFDNKIGFISFNYDRCFEKYLLDQTSESFRRRPEDVAPKLRTSFIGVHPHGSLGELWRMGKSTQPYGSDWKNVDLVVLATKSIKLITDKFDPKTDTGFRRAQKLIATARRVHFIGFGYHPNNMSRLGFGDSSALWNNSDEHYFFGTEKGLAPQRVFQITRQYQINQNVGNANLTSIISRPANGDAASYMELAPFD